MPKDYISRDIAISELMPIYKSASFRNVFATARKCLEAIENVPVADVVERKHGHWVIPVPGDGEPYCSECKKEAPTVGAFNMHSELTDFCPRCGADMRAANNG